MAMISVIIPVYNAEQYLENCIKSLMNQTYKDFELILVDDGSTDHSGKLCDDFQKYSEENRIPIQVLHQKNAGQSAARNRGLEIAKGRWVTFVDSDDYVHPQFLEILYSAVHRASTKLSMCSAVFNADSYTGDFDQYVKPTEKILKIDESFFWNLYHAEWTQQTYKNEVIWGKLYDINTVRKRPMEEGRIYEDTAIMGHWFVDAGTVVDIDCPLYYYVDNPNGTMNAMFSEKKLDKLWALEELEGLFLEKSYVRMAEFIQKSYCYVAFQYEQSCMNHHLARRLKWLRRKKVVRSIWGWQGSAKEKITGFVNNFWK